MRLPDHLGLALGARYLSHSLMVGLTLLNEPRPAPQLPDRVLELVPYVDWIARHNYHLWVLLYVPLALWLWRKDRAAFAHFLYVGAVLSLLRGLCVPLTGLGPPMGPDLNAGVSGAQLWQAWLAIVNPISALTGDAPQLHLTKDLFFSGHTSSTFLLWLYCRPHPVLGRLSLVAHLLVVATVLLSHLHYSIDIVGAWAITGWIFLLCRDRWPWATHFRARLPRRGAPSRPL